MSKKKFKIALARYEIYPEYEKPTKRNIAVYETWAVSEKQAINQVKFREWGKGEMTFIEKDSDPGHILWDQFEVWDGNEIINGITW